MRQSSSKPPAKGLVSVITASSVGTLIEWYDFYIFGSLATIISTQFFPKENPTAAFLATLATFAIGLIARPFGSLVFGRLGDLIGRKFTFMITLLIMGGATFAMGLVPKYETIGFWAPIIILILRLLQGLAIGGEYGGAATFVAEHSPPGQRGFYTSWIQVTPVFAFVISLSAILITKNAMDANSWEDWGWRIPFLVSIFMVIISVYIRKNMSESPLFARAKEEGKTSVNPLKESFGKKENLKKVLLALFGTTLGAGSMSWASVLYVQSFFIKIMFVEYEQANRIIIIGMLLGNGFNILFGWLSDKTGRKVFIFISMLLGLTCFRPIFNEMYQTGNLKNKIENTGAVKVETSHILLLPANDSLFTTSTIHFYTDGTTYHEIKKELLSSQKKRTIETIKSIKLNDADKWMLILMVVLMMFITAMSYGPLAAFLVEMFPLKIRYSSMSLPYHLGFGLFGGMCPLIGIYLIEKANAANQGNYYLAGLTYPLILISISIVIGLLYMKEKKEGVLIVPTPSKNWNKVKRVMGIVWIFLGVAAAYFGILKLGIPRLTSGHQDDLIFGIVITFFITPVATIGLLIFGKYCLDGEYNE